MLRLRLIRNYILHKLGKPRPLIVTLLLTHRCNLNCVFCPYKSDCLSNLHFPKPSDEAVFYLKKNKKEISTEQWKKIIDIFRSVPIIVFSGGEPLLRKDLSMLSSYTKSKNVSTCLTTNGTLFDKKTAAQLSESMDRIIFSIEGPEEVHDKLCGRGSFKKAIRGASYLFDNGFRVGVNYTLNILNYDKLLDFYHYVKDAGFSYIKFQPIHYVDPLALPLDKMVQTAHSIKTLKRADPAFFPDASFFLDSFVGFSKREKPPFCGALDLQVGVSPAGKLLCCCPNPIEVCDLLKQGFVKKKIDMSNCSGCLLTSQQYMQFFELPFYSIVLEYLKNLSRTYFKHGL